MRIINRITGKVYTDSNLAELLITETPLFHRNKIRDKCWAEYGGKLWTLHYYASETGNFIFLPPDRFTVCPDDCVTKEEVTEEIKEITSANAFERIESIANK